MTSPAVKGWLTFLLALTVAYAGYSYFRYWRFAINPELATAEPGVIDPFATDTSPNRPLSDFTFTERSGEPFSMRQLEGRVWVANVFFATCPGFCLDMNRAVAALHRDLADTNVAFVSFTVDPVVDTPEELRSYAERLEADPKRWLFLTGDLHEIRALVEGRLKLPASKTHNDKLAVVDRQGKVRGFFSSRDPVAVEKLKAKVRELVAEDAP